jgi:multiple sugar transport system permease protein
MVQARPLTSKTRAGSRLRVRARVMLTKGGYAVLLAIVLLAFLAPFVWMILNSLKTPLQISQTPPDLVFTPTLANYANVFGSQDFLTYMRNSAIIAGGSTLFALVLGLPAAYSIARFRQRTLSTAILVARIVPGITFLIPWFILFRQLHLVDTFLALILTHMLVGLPFIVWVMIPFFEAIPRELDEAARVDGCSIPSAFARVILPLSGPGVLSASILAFIFSWNNFMFSIVLATNRTKTLPVAIYNFISYAQIDWGGLMAAAVVITVPVLVLALVTQRFIVRGLTAGAVKG